MRRFWKAVIVAFAVGAAAPASATYSILACDADGTCGAAVATNNLAVGATVIYARAKVGAVASQFETNPSHGPKGLSLLAGGASAEAALDELLRTDDGFEGQDKTYRQIGIIGASGDGGAFTGAQAAASPWAGALTGPGYSIQGNGLAGAPVLAAMRDAYLGARGTLGERLMAALEAGDAAGGQSTGRLSAALLVRTPEGGFQDIDLRVDADDRPVAALRRLLGMHQANDAIARAERAARNRQPGAARRHLAEAVRLGAGWDRVWRRAARLAMMLGENGTALQALAALANANPTWAGIEIDDPIYASLWNDEDAARWRAERLQP
ncbi:DUF1028 domain-containing protein [Sphingomonas sanxanigenens]|uniref:DUF1028 domain-containing protein n=1 Tax=Sphingomonas sanxanigenens DSM 19645 = NX02 TaxID=1123269 RepID=W0A4I4_9SPHN|nr:DUF1028 domain-containing protein [Sphingomonas sanxanigenens]AHE51941.1 hypothetical protein NX02_00875 [Sphingomonas sanxanigenens DSM 19645 = NX02]